MIGQKHSIKIVNRSLPDMAKIKHLGKTLTDQKCMHEEIKSRLNSGNACHHLVQRLLSSWLVSRNIKVTIYKMIILPVVVYGCETWSLALREEHRPRVFENRMLRRIFGTTRNEVMGEWTRCTMGSFIICTHSSADKIRQSNKEVGKACGMHGRGQKRVQGFGWKAQRKEPLEDQDIDGKMGSEWILGR
jgi:hypothetical protein